MKLTVLKSGNLLGSPDVKRLLHACEQAGGSADALWDELAGIKVALGYDGQCSTFLLEDPARPDLFPAVVDPCFGSVEAGLAALAARGLEPGAIRSAMITHAHPDHIDGELLRALPRATTYACAPSPVPGCDPLPQDAFGSSVLALDTPGHGCPHASYILELAELALAVCLAGDLIMSHAHYLDLDHPYAFADHEAGQRSVAAVLSALRDAGRRHAVICPGHGRPFLVS
jgi:glyoxylase-like metal-dependent hydrolase (beta-lactamase superfamily II)